MKTISKAKYQLNFKWTTSRGQDTYGYNICSLYVNGVKSASTCGGGYDMQGTVFANWLQEAFKDELLEFAREEMQDAEKKTDQTYNSSCGGYYGFIITSGYEGHKTAFSLDGGCGFSCIEKIAKEILGFDLEYLGSLSGKNNSAYIMSN